MLENPGSGQTVVETVSELEGVTPYWYAFVAENDAAVVWTAPDKILTPAKSANEVVWVGSSSSTDSRVASNWLPARVPTATDTVIVSAEAAVSSSLNWYPDTGTGSVAGWRQMAGSTVYPVYFHTTAENSLTVTGDAEILSGTWTHTGPAENPETLVNVRVDGNLTVGANASIQAGTAGTGAEFRSRGYRRAAGPGYLRGAGGSFAGDGGHPVEVKDFVSYGSMLNPVDYGSGGWGDGEQYAGGGVIKLSVGGALVVDGTICSRGFGYALWGDEFVGGAGSGGSVNLTAATLSGSGTIDANGGNNGGYGPGSGGRVKIALTGTDATFASFTGKIEAIGGGMENADGAKAFDITPAAAGTICLQTAGADPVIKIYNVFRYNGVDTTWRVAEGALPSATHLPARWDGDELAALKKAQWEVSGHGALRLTADVKIGSLALATDDATQKVFLDGHKLTVSLLTVGGHSIAGTYTAKELNTKIGADVFAGEGTVTCVRGFTVIIR
ncbi:MAG: hypothetical protein ACI4TC_09665 [Kiritimatiellia bacterium]